MDEIYVNVAIHEGRARHYFWEDQNRWAYLKEFPPKAKDCYFAKPEDIIDKERYQVSSIEGCFDREFFRSKPKVSSIEAKVLIEE